MKVVFIGAGSHRYLGVARSILATPDLMAGGEIHLYDPALQRAEAVGRLITKCPEMANSDCRIVWGKTLDEALEGANAVIVVLMAGGRTNHGLCELACRRHGFLGSDQLSASGAMLALKGGPILMDLAQRMERLCPDAWLIDFANPVAVLSAAVNNHTGIRCLGVCEGYANHQWDLTRMLYGRDEQLTDYQVYSAGVNHLSFILPGSSHRGRDIYEMARERLTADWQMCALGERWSPVARASIAGGVTRLKKLYDRYGVLVFSSEGDGLAHLDIPGLYVPEAAPEPTPQELAAADEAGYAARVAADADFGAWIDRPMTQADWDTPRPGYGYLLRVDEDLMVKVVRAVGGAGAMNIATSYPNRGAVRGFKDRTVLEYSQVLDGNSLRAAGEFEVPDLFQGLISGLATHQTLLGDAIATRDPRVLYEALYSYPVFQDSSASRALWRDLLSTAGDTIPAEFAATAGYFA